MSSFIPHGGALDAAIAAHGGNADDWLDLSTGINPRGYPLPEIPRQIWERLPQASAMNECLAAARDYYVMPEAAAIVAGPGTQAIIQWIPHLWPEREAVVVSPTYGEYEQVFRAIGRSVSNVSDLQSISAGNAVIFIGNPNNPDGRVWAKSDCERLLDMGHCLVIDEAFADVAPDRSLIELADRENVLVLKSFGKFFGLAGVRLGFAIGQPFIIELMQRLLGPWPVAGPALAVGQQALSDVRWTTEARTWLGEQRASLEHTLQTSGFELVGSTDLFVTAAHPRADAICKALLSERVLVRPFDYAPKWLRFGLPGDHAELERLADVLRRIAR